MTRDELVKVIEETVKETMEKTWAEARAGFDTELLTYASTLDALAAKSEAEANGTSAGLRVAAGVLREVVAHPKRTVQLYP